MKLLYRRQIIHPHPAPTYTNLLSFSRHFILLGRLDASEYCQVDHWRKVISDTKLTDAAKAVASADAAAAAATEGSEQSEGRASPGVVEALDT